ncbi:MAG: hypothetical protein CVU51_01435 [Deltaproteobacteria bacterium HGW-Deltaproteobacteria-1]|jgi:type II secretory pathway pseudopilin PulG|nr:MAG: hypothetical protein CVU51_01435 [Deltaproteobacteria bacterium HGW-Deltaproteobacteria-1]
MNIFKKHLSKISSEIGATLIMIIVAMVVIAVIGAGLYTLSMTSALNQAEAQKAAKAFYISESCIRIAASEYKWAANKNSKLVELNGKTFTMPNNQGSCAVEIYPYWFYTTAVYAVGVTSITLYLPGDVPRISENEETTDYTTPVTFPASGYLRIKDEDRSPAWSGTMVLQYTGCSNCPPTPTHTLGANGTAVTFTLSTPLPSATIIGDEFYLGYQYTSTEPAPNVGGDLVLNITDTDDLSAKIFPPRRGSIFVEETSKISQYTYDERIIDTSVSPHTVTLKNIQAISGAPAPTFPVTVASVIPGTPIYMGKSLGLRSTSTFGN